MDAPPPVALTDATDTALVSAYLAHVRVEKRLAERTVALYTADLERLLRQAEAAGSGLRQVQNHHVRRWVAQMHGGGRSARGIALILSGWRGFYTWLGRQGQIAQNPVQDVRAPKAGKPLPKALAVDESVQLAAHSDPDADPRIEGLALRADWARDEEAALFIGSRGQRLTPQHIRVRLRQRSLQAGLAAPVHPHMLRHSYASHVLQSSGDLRAVQELLGHASISTTQVYTRLDFQHLAKVYDAAHPRAKGRGPSKS